MYARERKIRLEFVLFVSGALLSGCTDPDAPEERPNDQNLAAAFINKIEKDEGYRLGIRPDIEKELVSSKLEVTNLITGIREIIEHGSQLEKTKSVRFLGRLGNPSTIKFLHKTLADSNETVREEACYALQRMKAKGEGIEEALAGLCRNDASVAVRVAAASGLGRSRDADRLSAYQLGLSSKDNSVWEICEDELEKMGKLELPLPAHLYREISHSRYLEIKSDKWYFVQRETKRNSIIYIEVVERAHHVLLHRDWYKTKVIQ